MTYGSSSSMLVHQNGEEVKETTETAIDSSDEVTAYNAKLYP